MSNYLTDWMELLIMGFPTILSSRENFSIIETDHTQPSHSNCDRDMERDGVVEGGGGETTDLMPS